MPNSDISDAMEEQLTIIDNQDINVITEELNKLRLENASLKKNLTITPTKIALPEKFNGNRTEYRGFINQCQLLFLMNPQQYSTDISKVGLIISLLTNDALNWASPMVEKNNQLLLNYSLFITEMAKMFDDPQRYKTADIAIRKLKQGTNSVATYASNFRRIAMDLSWNDPPLISQFEAGLNEEVIDALTQLGHINTLELFIEAAIKADINIIMRKEKRDNRNKNNYYPTITQHKKSGPFGTTLSGKDKEGKTIKPTVSDLGGVVDLKQHKQLSPNKLLYSNLVHTIYTTVTSQPSQQLIINITLRIGKFKLKTNAMVDTGATGYFMDSQFAKNNRIQNYIKQIPTKVEFIDGSENPSGPITTETQVLSLTINNHHEFIIFDLLPIKHANIILGLPWLYEHNPLIDWRDSTILFNDIYCKRYCLLKNNNLYKNDKIVNSNIKITKQYNNKKTIKEQEKLQKKYYSPNTQEIFINNNNISIPTYNETVNKDTETNLENLNTKQNIYLPKDNTKVNSTENRNKNNFKNKIENVKDNGISPHTSSNLKSTINNPTEKTTSKYVLNKNTTTATYTTENNTTDYKTTDHKTTDHKTTDHKTTDHKTTDHKTTDYETTDYETTDYETTDYETNEQNFTTMDTKNNENPELDIIEMKTTAKADTNDTTRDIEIIDNKPNEKETIIINTNNQEISHQEETEKETIHPKTIDYNSEEPTLTNTKNPNVDMEDVDMEDIESSEEYQDEVPMIYEYYPIWEEKMYTDNYEK
ncbi:Retrotransposon-derived protein PEG10, partial [Zancudomyces culisetae]